MAPFTLDTSGVVEWRDSHGELMSFRWIDLTPFEQGFTRAMFAALRFFHMECPSCQWDCVVGPPGIGDLSICCPLCAADNGRAVSLRTVGGEGDLPANVEGHDARDALRFDRLHHSALERIREDCAEARADRRAGWREDSTLAGRQFWIYRQEDFRSWGDAWVYQMRNRFPPQTTFLNDEGKVCLREATRG